MKKLIFLISISFSFYNCSENEVIPPSIIKDDLAASYKIDSASDDILSILEEQELKTYNSELVLSASTNLKTINFNKIAVINSTISSCATVTREPAFGTPISVGTPITKTIDFGSTGCKINNGNVLKGKIILNYTYNPAAISHTLTYRLENFYHNDTKFEGTKTLTRTMTLATETSTSHPIVTMNIDLTTTLANGAVYKRTGQKVREIIEGYNTPLILLDNIYKITGAWSTILPDNSTLNAIITTPLEAKLSCLATNNFLIVKGIINYTKNEEIAIEDFGDGTCDNITIISVTRSVDQ